MTGLPGFPLVPYILGLWGGGELYWGHLRHHYAIGPTSTRARPFISPCPTILLKAVTSTWNCSTLCVNIFPEFAGAVAARPVSYAAVLRMKADSSSALNSHGRPRQHHRGGLDTREWPVFSSHPLSSVSLLSSQEDYMSEGKNPGRRSCLQPHGQAA